VRDLARFRQDYEALADWWRTVSCGHASVIELEVGALIAASHLCERLFEEALEIIHSIIVRAELFLEDTPSNKSRLARIETMQTLSQPGVYVEAHAGSVGRGT
jgi:hypothetical protein